MLLFFFLAAFFVRHRGGHQSASVLFGRFLVARVDLQVGVILSEPHLHARERWSDREAILPSLAESEQTSDTSLNPRLPIIIQLPTIVWDVRSSDYTLVCFSGL